MFLNNGIIGESAAMKNKILNLIESKEVRDCLSNNYNQLSKKQIIDIIYGAPSSLDEKYSIFKQLADEEETIGKTSYTEYAERLRTELNHLNLSDNEMFVLELKRLPKSDNSFSISYPLGVFSDTAKSLDVIKRKFIIDKYNCWYTLTKFKLNEGEKKHIIKYFISTDGEILFSDYHVKYKYDYYMPNMMIFIPLPFHVGDVVSIDSSPFAYPIYGVITEITNTPEGTHVKCLYFDNSGTAKIATLEDFSVFPNHVEIPLPSPLYRLKTVNNKLQGYDRRLSEISSILTEQDETNKDRYDSIKNI